MQIALTVQTKQALREALNTGFLEIDIFPEIAQIEAELKKLKEVIDIHNYNAMVRARSEGKI